MKMHRSLTLAGALVAALTLSAEASCYASYKAKRDDPLKLHFGVAEIRETCDADSAQVELTPRLAKDDWILLTIVEMIGEDKLGEVQARAGDYFLRY